MSRADQSALILIIVMGAVTLATRLLPYLVFGTKDTIPPLIVYLGRIIPYAAMGMLIIYSLKEVSISEAPYGIPEVLSVAAVAISYVWKRSTIFSVLAGTILYMVLVQMVF